MRKRIESHDFGLPGAPAASRAVRVTVSVGVASIRDGPTDVAALLHAADANLFRAKQRGRNRVVAERPDDAAARAGDDPRRSRGQATAPQATLPTA